MGGDLVGAEQRQNVVLPVKSTEVNSPTWEEAVAAAKSVRRGMLGYLELFGKDQARAGELGEFRVMLISLGQQLDDRVNQEASLEVMTITDFATITDHKGRGVIYPKGRRNLVFLGQYGDSSYFGGARKEEGNLPGLDVFRARVVGGGLMHLEKGSAFLGYDGSGGNPLFPSMPQEGDNFFSTSISGRSALIETGVRKVYKDTFQVVDQSRSGAPK